MYNNYVPVKACMSAVFCMVPGEAAVPCCALTQCVPARACLTVRPGRDIVRDGYYSDADMPGLIAAVWPLAPCSGTAEDSHGTCTSGLPGPG